QVVATWLAGAAARRHFSLPVLPVRARDDLADALGQADRTDLEPVGRERISLQNILQTQISRIDAELLCDLVELDLLAEARLRRAVAALGTAGRLVGEHARRVELVARQLVGHRLQRARIESARDAVAAIAAAVDQRLQVHAGE